MFLKFNNVIQLFNNRFLISNLNQNLIRHNYVNKYSTITIDPSIDKKKEESKKSELIDQTEIETKDKDNQVIKDEEKDNQITKDEDKDDLTKDDPKKKKKERFAVNTYSHNPPGLMEFFDDPKNWGESDVKSGRSWKVEELRNKSNSDLHKLWYVLLKEYNMLLTMQEAYKKRCEPLPSEERIFKVTDSMKNLEEVVRERNRAYWQLEVDQNETGERPAAFRKDIFGRYRWIHCSEHFVPMKLNRNWKLFNGVGTGKHVYEFMRRYREKQVKRKAAKLHEDAFTVRQLLRRFPRMDMEALQEKYPEIDIEAQKTKLDEDRPYRKIISRFFDQKF